MVRNEDMLNIHETEIYNHWQLQLTRELTKLHLGRCHPLKNSGSYSSLSCKPNAHRAKCRSFPRGVADGGSYIVGQHAD